MSNLPLKPVYTEIDYGEQHLTIKMIDHIRKSSNVLYGIFVELLRKLYSSSKHYAIGVPDIVWTNDNKTTEVWIDTELRWEDEHPEFRPAIYVKLDQLQYKSLTGRDDGLLGGDVESAESYYSRNGEGTVSFVHIGHTAGEACMLADNTLDYLDAFSRVIQCDFGFCGFHVVGRTALTAAQKESKDRKESVVTFAFSFQDTWTIKLESQHLKNITFKAGHKLAKSDIVLANEVS